MGPQGSCEKHARSCGSHAEAGESGGPRLGGPVFGIVARARRTGLELVSECRLRRIGGADYGLPRMSSAEIMEGRSMRIRRDETSSDEVLRAHVEAVKGANAGPLHIHVCQEERFIVDRGCCSFGAGASGSTLDPERTSGFRPRSGIPSRPRSIAPTRPSFVPRFASTSFSATCLRFPLISAATPGSPMLPACCAPTRRSSCTSPSSRCQSSGHWRCRFQSLDRLLAESSRYVAPRPARSARPHTDSGRRGLGEPRHRRARHDPRAPLQESRGPGDRRADRAGGGAALLASIATPALSSASPPSKAS
jgi:hypothetical protein